MLKRGRSSHQISYSPCCTWSNRLYHYTDYSRALASTAFASLPLQNWVIEQRRQLQWQQQQLWLDQKQQQGQEFNQLIGEQWQLPE